MIEFVNGDLFQSGVEALVNPVNCVGVSGAGLALEFKRRFLGPNQLYCAACRDRKIVPGKVFVVHIATFVLRYIVYFPTKLHWKNPSDLSYISSGLDSLAFEIDNYKIQSIAIPKLGCGLGGLNWSDVKSLIVDKLNDLNVKIMVYE